MATGKTIPAPNPLAPNDMDAYLSKQFPKAVAPAAPAPAAAPEPAPEAAPPPAQPEAAEPKANKPAAPKTKPAKEGAPAKSVLEQLPEVEVGPINRGERKRLSCDLPLSYQDEMEMYCKALGRATGTKVHVREVVWDALHHLLGNEDALRQRWKAMEAELDKKRNEGRLA